MHSANDGGHAPRPPGSALGTGEQSLLKIQFVIAIRRNKDAEISVSNDVTQDDRVTNTDSSTVNPLDADNIGNS